VGRSMAPTRHLPRPRRVRPGKLASTVPSSSPLAPPRLRHSLANLASLLLSTCSKEHPQLQFFKGVSVCLHLVRHGKLPKWGGHGEENIGIENVQMAWLPRGEIPNSAICTCLWVFFLNIWTRGRRFYSSFQGEGDQ
jgi:hypothetical protein